MAVCREDVTAEYVKAVKGIDANFNKEKAKIVSEFKISNADADRINGLAELGALVTGKNRAVYVLGSNPLGKWFGKAFQGLSTTLDQSNNLAVRGLNRVLFESGQVGSLDGIRSVSILSKVNKNLIKGELKGKHLEAFNMRMQEQYPDIGWTGRKMKEIQAKEHEKFEREVMLEVMYPNPDAPPSVKHYAQGLRDAYRKAWEIQRDAGVAGFDGAPPSNYFPRLTSDNGIDKALSDATARYGSREAGESAVVEALATAYYKGDNKLKDMNMARFIAKGILIRNNNRKLTMREAYNSVGDQDFGDIEAILREAELDEESIATFLDAKRADGEREHMSNRAKRSLNPDLRVSMNGIDVVDLFDTNIEKVTSRYINDASALSGLAYNGFRTERQLDDTLRALEKDMHNTGASRAEIDEVIEQFETGKDLLFERSIDGDASKKLIKFTARLRNFTAFKALQNAGYYSMPEISRAITSAGINTTIKNTPAMKELLTTSAVIRDGGKISGDMVDPVRAEIDMIMPYLGDEASIDFRGVRSDELEETASSQFGRVFDRSLREGQYYEGFTSGMRVFQSGGEKTAGVNFHRLLLDHVIEGGTFKPHELRRMGWSEKSYDELKSRLKDNLIEVEHEGKKIKLLDFDNLDYIDRTEIRTSAYRYVNDNMLQTNIGERSTIQDTWYGKLFFQFRGFGIGSLDKQLVHDIRADKAMFATNGLWNLALATTAHIAYTNARAVGMEKKEREKFLDANLSEKGLTLGALNRSAYYASLGLAVDFGASFGLVPDAVMATGGSAGARGLDITQAPSFGTIQQLYGVSNSAVGFVTGEKDLKQAIDATSKLIYPANTLGFANALQAINQ